MIPSVADAVRLMITLSDAVGSAFCDQFAVVAQAVPEVNVLAAARRFPEIIPDAAQTSGINKVFAFMGNSWVVGRSYN